MAAPGSPIPGILQARTLEWVAISFSNATKWKVKLKLLSRVQPSATPWTAAFQAPPSMGFSRQEYWSGVPLPSPLFFLVKGNCQFKDISKIYIKNKKPHLLQGFIMLSTNIFMFLIRYFIDLRLTIETRCPKNTLLFATKKDIVISNNTSVMC